MESSGENKHTRCVGARWPTSAAESDRVVKLGESQRPLRAAVTDEIRLQIIRGELEPGERIFEEDVAASLGVSRNPVREALQALAAEGFVRIEPRRGAHVAVVDANKANELFEIRVPLEGLVAELAAKRRTPAQLDALSAMTDEALALVRSNQLELLPELNTQFHDALAEAAANELLASTLHRLSHLVQWVYSARIKERSTDSWAEHAALIDAIGRQDAISARRLSEAHVTAARVAFLGAETHAADRDTS